MQDISWLCQTSCIIIHTCVEIMQESSRTNSHVQCFKANEDFMILHACMDFMHNVDFMHDSSGLHRVDC